MTELRPHWRFGNRLFVCDGCNQRPAPPIVPERVEQREVWIYLIQVGKAGPIKIGTAVSPEERLALFQTGNHQPLYLLRKVRGTQADERYLHRLFTYYRVRGEWFKPEILPQFDEIQRERELASAEQ